MKLPSYELQKAYFLTLDGNTTNFDTVSYVSNFTSGNEDLAEIRGTGGDGVLIGDLKDVYQFTFNDETGIHGIGLVDVLSITKVNRVSFDYYIPSGQTIQSLRLRTQDMSDGDYRLETQDAWTSYSLDWSPTIGDNFLLHALNSGASDTFAAEGDVFYLKNIIIRTGNPVPVFDVVPPGQDYPYIVLTAQNVVETNFNTTRRLTEIVTDVDVVTGFEGSFGGKKQCYEISDQVITLIRQTPGNYVSLQGFTMLTSVLESTVTTEVQSETHTLFINRIRFRHKIQEN